MNFFGAGPRIGKITLPWLALTIMLTLINRDIFVFTPIPDRYFYLAGYIILAAGLFFYFATVRVLLKGLKEGKLVTTGGFYFCQSPLYASILLFIIPAIALLMNSWLVLTTTAAGYIAFKFCIKSEYLELEETFGDTYLKYRKKTPEFFPLPLKKIWNRE